jgi:hypothetical protein
MCHSHVIVYYIVLCFIILTLTYIAIIGFFQLRVMWLLQTEQIVVFPELQDNSVKRVTAVLTMP